MSEIANSDGSGLPAARADAELQARLLLFMAAGIAVSVAVSVPLAPWRVTAGLLLGGSLSLFNHHWMRSSIASLIGAGAQGRQVKARASRYLLRYFVIALVCAVAYKLNLVSLPATLAGLCSFVVAIFVEAFRRFYFVIIHREETN